MKFKFQSIIIIFGILSIIYGFLKILEVQTLILTPIYFAIFGSILVTLVSLILGYVLKYLFVLKWHSITISSLLLILAALTYSICDYTPQHDIIIPDNYYGEVKLFVTNRQENDFIINNSGIGYINKKTYDEGFSPRIMKGGIDITKQVLGYSKGSLATGPKDIYTFQFLSFDIPNKIKYSLDHTVI
jgi:hypothetical protein